MLASLSCGKIETNVGCALSCSDLFDMNTSLFNQYLLNMYLSVAFFKRKYQFKKIWLSVLQASKLLSKDKKDKGKLLRFKYIHEGKAKEIWDQEAD